MLDKTVETLKEVVGGERGERAHAENKPSWVVRLCKKDSEFCEDVLFSIEFSPDDEPISNVANVLASRLQSALRGADARCDGSRTLTPSGGMIESSLSCRELEMLRLIARGYSYAETAKLTGITVETVNVHLRNAYRKLDVHSKTEAVFEARQMGWIDG